ncbi:phage major tail tube protein [Helicobacter cynogastricus]|uniref:phage major tail tube protein n=1 Tax=Helicobacter cynogastricus TaxID=329937 RepID=UPI000CF0887A|nr:phage major tail tube protein [Helicobacter cynogastricus]
MNRIDPQAFSGGNVFIDGLGYAGALKDFEPPKIEHETIEANASIGKREYVLPTLKPLSAKVSFQALDKAFFSLLKKGTMQKIVIKSNVSSSSDTGAPTDTPVHVTLEGAIKSAEPPKFEMGKELELSLEMSVLKFAYRLGVEDVINYDTFTSTLKYAGEDQFANIRNNIT